MPLWKFSGAGDQAIWSSLVLKVSAEKAWSRQKKGVARSFCNFARGCHVSCRRRRFSQARGALVTSPIFVCSSTTASHSSPAAALVLSPNWVIARKMEGGNELEERGAGSTMATGWRHTHARTHGQCHLHHQLLLLSAFTNFIPRSPKSPTTSINLQCYSLVSLCLRRSFYLSS